MNERLEALRQRLRQRPIQPTNPFQFKNWGHLISIGVAVISFAISILAFYFSTLQQTDDISVNLRDRVITASHPDGGEPTTMYVDGSMTFINSGNRSAAVSRMKLMVFRPEKRMPDSCAAMKSIGGAIEFSPFVIKPGEIVFAKVKHGGLILAEADYKRDDGSYGIRACIVFEIATPTKFETISKIAFTTLSDNANLGNFLTHQTEDRPVSLVQERGTIFSGKD